MSTLARITIAVAVGMVIGSVTAAVLHAIDDNWLAATLNLALATAWALIAFQRWLIEDQQQLIDRYRQTLTDIVGAARAYLARQQEEEHR